MQLTLQQSGQWIRLNEREVLGMGGEARLFAVKGHPEWAAKVYHKAGGHRTGKLAVMTANPPEDLMAARGHASIAWPLDLLVDGAGTVVGFIMPRVNGTRPLVDYFNPKTRRQECPGFTYFYLQRTARNLAAAVQSLHARGYVIGDVNDSNILVSATALATLVDTDSFQVRDYGSGQTYRCRVGRPEYSAPEVLRQVSVGRSYGDFDREAEQDCFGLGVLIFQLLMEGTHPFAGIYRGAGDAPGYGERIEAGHFAYYGGVAVPYGPMPLAPPFEMLHPRVREAFLECFVEGRAQPGARPSALAWVRLLDEAAREVVYCQANGQHCYWRHLSACPWCERTARLGGRDPFPAIPKSAVAIPVPSAVAAPVEETAPPGEVHPPLRLALHLAPPAPEVPPVPPQSAPAPPPDLKGVFKLWLGHQWRTHNLPAWGAFAAALLGIVLLVLSTKPWSAQAPAALGGRTMPPGMQRFLPPKAGPFEMAGRRLLGGSSWNRILVLTLLGAGGGLAGWVISLRRSRSGRGFAGTAIALSIVTASSGMLLVQLARKPGSTIVRTKPNPGKPPRVPTSWATNLQSRGEITAKPPWGTGGRIGAIHSLAFAPDNRTLFVGTKTRILAWDLPQAELVRWFPNTNASSDWRYKTPDMSVMALSADGSRIALPNTYPNEGQVDIWSAQTGQWVKTLRAGNSDAKIIALVLSPDGQKLVVGLDSRYSFNNLKAHIEVWHVENDTTLYSLKAPDLKSQLRSLVPQSLHTLALSPDGSLLAASFRVGSGANRGGFYLWSMTNGALLKTLTQPSSGQNLVGRLSSIGFSPDGASLAGGYVGVKNQGDIKFWSIPDGTMQRALPVPLGMLPTSIYGSRDVDTFPLAFSGDGQCLALGTKARDDSACLHVWNLKSNRWQQNIPNLPSAEKADRRSVLARTTALKALAYSRNGKFLACATDYNISSDAEVLLYDTEHWGEPWRLSQTDLNGTKRPTSVALSPDGQIMAVVSGASRRSFKLKLWDLSSAYNPRLMTTLSDETTATNVLLLPRISTAMAFSTDGASLALASTVAGSTELQVLEVASRKRLRTFALSAPYGSQTNSSVDSLALAPNGTNFLLLRTSDGGKTEVQVWNLSDQTKESAYSLPRAAMTKGMMACVGYFADGTPVAFVAEYAANSINLEIHDAKAGRLLKNQTFAVTDLASESMVTGMALAHEAQLLLLTIRKPDSSYPLVRVLDLRNERTWPISGEGTLVVEGASVCAISSNGRRVCAIGIDEVKIADFTSTPVFR